MDYGLWQWYLLTSSVIAHQEQRIEVSRESLFPMPLCKLSCSVSTIQEIVTVMSLSRLNPEFQYSHACFARQCCGQQDKQLSRYSRTPMRATLFKGESRLRATNSWDTNTPLSQQSIPIRGFHLRGKLFVETDTVPLIEVLLYMQSHSCKLVFFALQLSQVTSSTRYMHVIPSNSIP